MASNSCDTRYKSPVYDDDKYYFPEKIIARIPFKWEAAPGTPNKKFAARLSKNHYIFGHDNGALAPADKHVGACDDDVDGDTVPGADMDVDVAADVDKEAGDNADVDTDVAVGVVAIDTDEKATESSNRNYYSLQPPPGKLALPTPFRVKDILEMQYQTLARHPNGCIDEDDGDEDDGDEDDGDEDDGDDDDNDEYFDKSLQRYHNNGGGRRMARSFRFMSFRSGHNASVVPLTTEKSKVRSQSCLDRRDVTTMSPSNMLAIATSHKLRDLMQQSNNFSELLALANKVADTDQTKKSKKKKKKKKEKKMKDRIRHWYINPVPSHANAQYEVEEELAKTLCSNKTDAADQLVLDSSQYSHPLIDDDVKMCSPEHDTTDPDTHHNHESPAKLRFFPIYTCTACWR